MTSTIGRKGFGIGESAPPIPDFLLPVRVQVAAWAGIDATAFAMALINEYPAGATIGWHRDAPQYGIIAGISLLSSCRMKLRPYVSPADARQSAGFGRAKPRRTTRHGAKRLRAQHPGHDGAAVFDYVQDTAVVSFQLSVSSAKKTTGGEWHSAL